MKHSTGKIKFIPTIFIDICKYDHQTILLSTTISQFKINMTITMYVTTQSLPQTQMPIKSEQWLLDKLIVGILIHYLFAFSCKLYLLKL